MSGLAELRHQLETFSDEIDSKLKADEIVLSCTFTQDDGIALSQSADNFIKPTMQHCTVDCLSVRLSAVVCAVSKRCKIG